jgi:hypothetical protein
MTPIRGVVMGMKVNGVVGGGGLEVGGWGVGRWVGGGVGRWAAVSRGFFDGFAKV